MQAKRCFDEQESHKRQPQRVRRQLSSKPGICTEAAVVDASEISGKVSFAAARRDPSTPEHTPGLLEQMLEGSTMRKAYRRVLSNNGASPMNQALPARYFDAGGMIRLSTYHRKLQQTSGTAEYGTLRTVM